MYTIKQGKSHIFIKSNQTPNSNGFKINTIDLGEDIAISFKSDELGYAFLGRQIPINDLKISVFDKLNWDSLKNSLDIHIVGGDCSETSISYYNDLLELIASYNKEEQINIYSAVNEVFHPDYLTLSVNVLEAENLFYIFVNKNTVSIPSSYYNNKSAGSFMYEDGMLDQDIELNLKLMKENIKYHGKESEFYLEEKVLNKSNIIDSINKWFIKESSTKEKEGIQDNQQKNFLAIVTVINEAGKKHALALHLEKIGDLVKTSIIDPLSCDKSEFKKEITGLQNKLSVFAGVSYQIYSGKQDDKSATCGDVSLFELFEILNSRIGIDNKEVSNNLSNINDYIPNNVPEVYVNDSIGYTLNEKLQAQTEYYLETGTVFETFRTAVESNQITVIQPQLSNNNENSLLVARDNVNADVANNYLYDLPSHLLTMRAPNPLDIGLLRLAEHNVECAFNTADNLDIGNIIDYNMSVDSSYNFQGS